MTVIPLLPHIHDVTVILQNRQIEHSIKFHYNFKDLSQPSPHPISDDLHYDSVIHAAYTNLTFVLYLCVSSL